MAARSGNRARNQLTGLDGNQNSKWFDSKKRKNKRLRKAQQRSRRSNR